MGAGTSLRKVELPRFDVQHYGTMVQWALDEVVYGYWVKFPVSSEILAIAVLR